MSTTPNWKIFIVVIFAPFMSAMDATLLNVSLPVISQALHSPIAATQWIISGYLIALALMLPLSHWLVDRIGIKRLYLICFSFFILTSLLCAISHTVSELVAARVLQGIAGGLLAPLAQLILVQVAGSQLARIKGYLAIPVLLAPMLAPILAGTILQYAHWPWLFLVNVPIGILALTLAIFLLPADNINFRKQHFDSLGFLIISLGLICLLYGLEQSTSSRGIYILILGVIFLALFIWHAARKKGEALIDIGIFNNRFFSTSAAIQFLAIGISYGGQFLIPLCLINGFGLNTHQASWIISTMGMGMLCGYPFMGFLTDRLGYRRLVISGIVLYCVGTLPFLWMTEHHFSMILALACLFIRGIAQGAINIPLLSATYIAIPKEMISLANTTANIAQRLGPPVLIALLGASLHFSTTDLPVSKSQIFLIPFVVLIGVQLLILGLATRLYDSGSY